MKNLKKEQRVDEILLSLKRLDYLCTTQIQKLHNLGGERNTRRFMQSMSEYVSNFRDMENVYYLNKKGRERISSDVIRSKISPCTHYLMRNDFYIKNRPELFETEQIVEVGKVRVRPDVWVKLRGGYYFLEIDNTQRMVKNEQKIEKYRQLLDTGAFQKQFGYFPRILWVTCLASRKKSLANKCKEMGLQTTVIQWEELR